MITSAFPFLLNRLILPYRQHLYVYSVHWVLSMSTSFTVDVDTTTSSFATMKKNWFFRYFVLFRVYLYWWWVCEKMANLNRFYFASDILVLIQKSIKCMIDGVLENKLNFSMYLFIERFWAIRIRYTFRLLKGNTWNEATGG